MSAALNGPSQADISHTVSRSGLPIQKKTLGRAGTTLNRDKIKTLPRKWAGTPNNGSGLRGADGTISDDRHGGLPVTLADDGHDDNTVATPRMEATADAA